MRSRRAFFWAILAVAFLVGSCSDVDGTGRMESGDSPVSTSTATQSLTADQLTLTVSVPTGVSASSLGLVGGASITLGKGAMVVDLDGNPASIANLGTGKMSIGQAAFVGTAWSSNAAVLEKNALLTGDLHVGGTLTMQTGAIVTGSIFEAPFPQTQVSQLIEFPTGATEQFRANPHEQKLLKPGAYKEVRVQPNAIATLGAGTYFAESIVVQPGASVVLDASSGPILVYVRSS